MTIEEIKMIPIKDILSHMGIEPVMSRCGGEQLMYNSPLAIALKGDCTFSEALAWLEEQVGGLDMVVSEGGINRFLEELSSKQQDKPFLSNVQVEELTNPSLLRYLESRGIPAEIGWRYCKEAHYTVRDREYFSIAFMNILGGMELRNRYFKGCHGAKALTIDRVDKSQRTPTCCVFEGFMDFLTYRLLEDSGDCELVPRRPCDCIILNSTCITAQAIPFIDVYRCAYCFLDNDYAGRQAFGTLCRAMPGRIHDMSSKFMPYNDLNDYEQLMQATVNDRFYYLRHQAELGGRLFQQALNDINRAIEMAPKNDLYYAEKASLLVRVGLYDEAIETANECIRIAPDYSDGYLFLGIALCQKGQKAEGLQNLRKAKEMGDPQADTLIERFSKD